MTTQLFQKTIPQKDLETLIREALFNQHQQPPDEIVVWRIEGQNIGSLGNFSLLTGLPKAGKGKYICGMTAAALTRSDIFGQWFRLPPDRRGISYWDTEQSRYDHYQMLQLIKQLADINELPAHYNSYHCRRYEASTIIAMIEHELQTKPDTGFLILDGLLDLIDSFNDEKQSKALVNFLKRITDVYNILVLGVLHRSKSADKSMGHLGSAADRAAQSVLKVEKDKERKQYILSAEYLRSGDDFTPIAIYYNKQRHCWEQCDYIAPDQEQPKPGKQVQPKPQDLDLSAHTLNVLRIFNSQPVQDYETLIQNIREIYGRGRNWAVACHQYLHLELKIIFKTPAGYTNIQQQRLTGIA